MDRILTPELQDYYENRFRMFGTQGWKDLIDDIIRMHQATNNIKGIITQEQLHFKKGELSIMEWLIGLEELSRKAYDGLLLEEQEQKESTDADI